MPSPIYLFNFSSAEDRTKALCMLSRHSTTKLHPRPRFSISVCPCPHSCVSALLVTGPVMLPKVCGPHHCLGLGRSAIPCSTRTSIFMCCKSHCQPQSPTCSRARGALSIHGLYPGPGAGAKPQSHCSIPTVVWEALDSSS
jgi:hypothetical protein